MTVPDAPAHDAPGGAEPRPAGNGAEPRAAGSDDEPRAAGSDDGPRRGVVADDDGPGGPITPLDPGAPPAAQAGAPWAVLWDMDGLLVDTEPLWTVAETELCSRWGLDFTAELKAAIVGTRLDAAVAALRAAGGAAAAAEPAAEVAGWLLARMRSLFERPLPLRPGAAELLRGLAAAGARQALVSSSYRVLVDAVLAGLPGHPFTVTVAGDEVQRGKPDPEPYRRAAHALGVPPRRCVVLEDSAAGARSGAAAGAAVVYCPAVPGAPPAEPGWAAVDTLEVVDAESCARLVAAVTQPRPAVR